MGRYGILQFVFSLHQYEQPKLYALLGQAIRPTQKKNDRSTSKKRGLFTIMTSEDSRSPPSVAAGVSTEIVGPGVRTEIVLKF